MQCGPFEGSAFEDILGEKKKFFKLALALESEEQLEEKRLEHSYCQTASGHQLQPGLLRQVILKHHCSSALPSLGGCVWAWRKQRSKRLWFRSYSFPGQAKKWVLGRDNPYCVMRFFWVRLAFSSSEAARLVFQKHGLIVFQVSKISWIAMAPTRDQEFTVRLY